MSQSPHVVKGLRWGRRMGDEAMIDAMTAALTDPFGAGHMGVTAENIAERHDITREMQDALAVESHRRAARAQSEGWFDSQIVPVEIKARGTVKSFSHDEHIRAGVDAAGLAALAPVFRKEKGTVTAGNASGLNDGGAALVLASGEEARRRRLTPMARIVGWGHAGVAPDVRRMPIKVTRALLNAALDGGLEGITFNTDTIFGFEVPLAAPGVFEDVLQPRETWADKDAYDRAALNLALQFTENFKQFEDKVDAEVLVAGPRVLNKDGVSRRLRFGTQAGAASFTYDS
ncbi:phosphoenolpyruvate carboxykinase (ATP) [Sphingomonas sp.]|uniref:thiolase family protein n=1 Tax=Sphingomonas sp. TaxID=28214 RepID=UPI00307F22F3